MLLAHQACRSSYSTCLLLPTFLQSQVEEDSIMDLLNTLVRTTLFCLSLATAFLPQARVSIPTMEASGTKSTSLSSRPKNRRASCRTPIVNHTPTVIACVKRVLLYNPLCRSADYNKVICEVQNMLCSGKPVWYPRRLVVSQRCAKACQKASVCCPSLQAADVYRSKESPQCLPDIPCYPQGGCLHP